METGEIYVCLHLYQLPPAGECPVYMHPGTVHTLDDFAANGWEKMQLHELNDIM